MNRKVRSLLTAMIVIVIVAIYAVGIFLLWDVFSVDNQLDALFNTEFYGAENPLHSSVSVNVKLDGKTVTEAEEKLLTDYFTYYYAGLGALSAEKISHLYMFQTDDELFDSMALDYEVFLANKCPADLSFDECTIHLDIKRRHSVPKSSKIEIDLELSAVIPYKGTGQDAVIRGESHSFVVDIEGKKTLIAGHTTDKAVRAAAEYELDSVLSSHKLLRSDLNYSYFPKYTEEALSRLKADMNGFSFKNADISGYPEAEIEYDRDTAASAAVNGFSSDGVFAEYEENDANYVSRCIFEGGIPMDSQGDRYDQWKWYDDEVNIERKKTGCSLSWYDRDMFYTYVKTNSGFGLVGCETESGGGELGDVIQIMHRGEPVSELMITGVMVTAEGKVKDYLVSNDTLSAVPLMSLGYTDFRVLHIVGYNTANI